MDGVAELTIDHRVLYRPVLVDAEIVESVDSPVRNLVAQAYAHVVLVSVGISRFTRRRRRGGVEKGVPSTKGDGVAHRVSRPDFDHPGTLPVEWHRVAGHTRRGNFLGNIHFHVLETRPPDKLRVGGNDESG